MGAGSSSSSNAANEPAETPVQTIETNNLELLMFLFLLLVTMLAMVFISLAVIFTWYPNIVNTNSCVTISTAGGSVGATRAGAGNNRVPKQSLPLKNQHTTFDSYGSWLARIRTTKPPIKPPPAN
jgi:hypothetical protein